MTKRMLIDSTHAEETRVVVLDGNRLEDYDVETSTKQQLKGNIYLAKIVRVEPSLQAAFVEFGGGRHGFLAFGEIHPDYYQIPVADRKRLLEMQEAEAREEDEEEERQAARQERADAKRAADAVAPEPNGESEGEPSGNNQDDPVAASEDEAAANPAEPVAAQPLSIAHDVITAPDEAGADMAPEAAEPAHVDGHDAEAPLLDIDTAEQPGPGQAADPDHNDTASPTDLAETGDSQPLAHDEAAPALPHDDAPDDALENAPQDLPEDLGGEHDTDDQQDRRSTPRFLRNYKIQEVIRRRQILLVQVVKEERGSKGAALTTYISLAGRFSVLMPNSPRGGGISRKITSAADRRRLKEITSELDLPRGMGLIVRTAGANRPKPEIIRDCEYLLNQWDQIRDLTMKSMAPALIYEEASLIKRAIRDVYSRDVEEILVDGEDGWRAARDFMRMLMPAHAKKVQLWRDPQPLFAKAQVESQLDAMLQPTVQLRSGGYLVINQTEALVAIDVNSGRSTRERGIEETAFRTNIEAAEETARQLRLRDLAGLIVIDFIDMESRRNNTAVEKKLKDSLKDDRARIQVGSISHFGLMEMSRQRLRPSLAETSFVACVHCGGTGHMRSTESAALAVLRGIEDEGGKRRAAEIVVHVHGSIAMYILNHKRVRLSEIEARFGLHVIFNADETLIPPQMRIEKIRALSADEAAMPVAQLPPPDAQDDSDADETVMEAESVTEADAEDDEDEPTSNGEASEDSEQRGKKRRRRRRGGRRDDAVPATDAAPSDDSAPSEPGEPGAEDAPTEGAAAPDGDTTEDGPPIDGERKRRGRRGGRRRRREPSTGTEAPASGEAVAAAPEPDDEPMPAPALPPAPFVPAYVGPTPADPFGAGSNAFDFFDAVEEAEQAKVMERVTPAPEPALATAPAPEPAVAIEQRASEPTDAPVPGVAPAPILIGDPDAPAGEKKRGWWRR